MRSDLSDAVTASLGKSKPVKAAQKKVDSLLAEQTALSNERTALQSASDDHVASLASAQALAGRGVESGPKAAQAAEKKATTLARDIARKDSALAAIAAELVQARVSFAEVITQECDKQQTEIRRTAAQHAADADKHLAGLRDVMAELTLMHKESSGLMRASLAAQKAVGDLNDAQHDVYLVGANLGAFKHPGKALSRLTQRNIYRAGKRPASMVESLGLSD